jgi:hypothetical protein
VATNTYQRHDYQMVGGSGKRILCQAWHISLPGHSTYVECEQWENLSKWVGTKMQGQDDPNPERTAGLALMKTAWCPESEGYHLEERDGHWFLHKHERVVRYFTLQAFYRIGPWKVVVPVSSLAV